VTALHSLIKRPKVACILACYTRTYTGNVILADNHHLLIPCSSYRSTVLTGTKLGRLVSIHIAYSISAARAIAHMSFPMLLHRLANALRVRDPHRVLPSNVPELH
jgi:hypothetical protein